MSGAVVDYEAEVVVVIGRRVPTLSEADASGVVAGSPPAKTSRITRCSSPARPRSSAWGRASAAYGPTGPAVVSLDNFGIPTTSRVALRSVGEVVQDSSTAQLIFTVFPKFVLCISLRSHAVSRRPHLSPGTPDGVGITRAAFSPPGMRS